MNSPSLKPVDPSDVGVLRLMQDSNGSDKVANGEFMASVCFDLPDVLVVVEMSGGHLSFEVDQRVEVMALSDVLEQRLQLIAEEEIIWAIEVCPDRLVEGELVCICVYVAACARISVPMPCSSHIGSSIDSDYIQTLLLEQIE